MKRKKILFQIVSVMLSIAVHAQPGRIDSSFVTKPYPHFQSEYTVDVSTNPAAWEQNQPHGLSAFFVSTDRAWFRTEAVGPEMRETVCHETGWRGERINLMILVSSPDTLNQVRFLLSDLKDGNGHILSTKNFTLNMVRYVLSNYPYDAADVNCGEDQLRKVYLMPDRLESFERFDLPRKTVRPVWLSIDIPAGAVAGNYKGSVKIQSERSDATLDLVITVQELVLPKPQDWSFRLDLWQNPLIVSLYNGVKPWSAEHRGLLKKHLKLYADAGGKFITANVVDRVWADDTYGSLVEWIKRRDGTWKFDYSHFDEYIQLAIETGIDKAITIYSPIPYGESFPYLDELTGNYLSERWQPTSETFRKNWAIFLKDLKSHLEKKGWFDKTYIGINENAPEQTLAAINMVKAQSPKWKITYAGDWHPELDSLLNDYCCIFGKEPPVSAVRKRSSSGRTSTFYVCCTPPKPNNFVFSPPVEGRWIGWYTYAHSYDGFLRWAYDSWPADVMHDARNLHWNGGAGDCYMIYPGGKSSIRFEKMREGIVEYEKLRIIKAKASGSANADVKRLLRELEEHLQIINAEKELKKEKLETQIQKGRKLINELSDKLAEARNFSLRMLQRR